MNFLHEILMSPDAGWIISFAVSLLVCIGLFCAWATGIGMPKAGDK